MNFLKSLYYKYLVRYQRYNCKDDETFVKNQYYQKTGRKLDLAHPREFTEKLQWLKLNKYDESYGIYADKYAARDYVIEKIGVDYLNKLYGVYEDPEQIDLDQLPDQFVLKGVHGSNFNILVDDKSKLDWGKTKQKLKKFLTKNYYLRCRERVYKDIKPRIVAERFLIPPDNQPVLDYKILCFDGLPACIYVEDHTKILGYYDMDWNRLDDRQNPHPTLPKPDNLEEVKTVASNLSEGFIFIRVDLYLIGQEIYFGELTFFDYAGIRRLPVEHLNRDFGDLIKLPTDHQERHQWRSS